MNNISRVILDFGRFNWCESEFCDRTHCELGLCKVDTVLFLGNRECGTIGIEGPKVDLEGLRLHDMSLILHL
jgi:hypothetical protein